MLRQLRRPTAGDFVIYHYLLLRVISDSDSKLGRGVYSLCTCRLGKKTKFSTRRNGTSYDK